ncbi:MAG: hypothetical protein AAFR81_06345 [Chloroflexota bacterium]
MRHKEQWAWVEEASASWGFLVRVIIKACVLFALCNLIFALVYPMAWLGQWSLYGILYPARDRLPYTDAPSVAIQAEANNLTLSNLPAMVASHNVSQSSDDEFRVFVIGDSSVWGFLLTSEQTFTGQLNNAEIRYEQQDVVAYNLGYPTQSLLKDILILDAVMGYEPDMIIWFVTLDSFALGNQLETPLVQENPLAVERLTAEYNLTSVNLADTRFVRVTFWEQTLIGQRQVLAELLHLQTFGVGWSATGIDHRIPDTFPSNQVDLSDSISWAQFESPTTFITTDLAFDIFEAGVRISGNTPLVVVNEPMFISDGDNSDVRYNSLYPQWAYDAYRVLLDEQARDAKWQYIDLWDAIAPSEFTDSPVHLTPSGTTQVVDILTPILFEIQE